MTATAWSARTRNSSICRSPRSRMTMISFSTSSISRRASAGRSSIDSTSSAICYLLAVPETSLAQQPQTQPVLLGVPPARRRQLRPVVADLLQGLGRLDSVTGQGVAEPAGQHLAGRRLVGGAQNHHRALQAVMV